MYCSFNLSLIPSRIRLTMFLTLSFPNALNTMISSILFKNSGLNLCFISSKTASFVGSLTIGSFKMISLPMFDVIITIVFLKSTILPLPSVSLPSSNNCNNTLNTSGCAFSISSNRITE